MNIHIRKQKHCFEEYYKVFEKNQNTFAFIIIFLIVVIFNLEAVFGLKTLISDDYARFYHAINNNIFRTDAFRLMTALRQAFNKSLMLVDIHFARLIYVLIFYIPLSYILFRLNRDSFGLSYSSSCFSSIIINILPFQTQLPAFIDGSYSVIGLIFFFLSITFALKYLKKENTNILLLALLFWFTGSYLFSIAELYLFLLPSVFILFIAFNAGTWKKKIVLVSSFLIISSYRIFLALLSISSGTTRAAATPASLSIDIMKSRLELFFSWSSLIPADFDESKFVFSQQHYLFTIFLIVICIMVGLIILNKNSLNKRNTFAAMLFYSLLTVFAAFPFITTSPFLNPRHFFVAHIGLIITYIFFLDLIVKHMFRYSKSKKTISFTLLLIITLSIGIQRQYNLRSFYGHQNKVFEKLCNQVHTLGEVEYGSQIVITGYHSPIPEHFIWSSGLYSFCLEKPGVVGILGKEYSFYDPFQPEHRAYGYKMGGLDINSPIYILNYSNNSFHKPDYMLRWHEKNNEGSIWTVYVIDELTQRLSEFASGCGVEKYVAFLNNNDISQSEVLWGKADPLRKWTKLLH